MNTSEKEVDEMWVFQIGGVNTSFMKSSILVLGELNLQELAGSHQEEVQRESRDVGRHGWVSTRVSLWPQTHTLLFSG